MRLRAFLRWLFIDARPAWLALGVPVASIVVAWRLPGRFEFNVRGAGYALTVLGIFVAVHGIREKQRLFGRPSFLQRVRTWAVRLPTFFGNLKPNTVTLEASGGASATAFGDLHVTVRVGPDASLEQRVRAIERNAEILTERFSHVERRTANDLRELRDAQTRQLSDMKTADEELRVRLEQLSVGGLDVEIAAVAWVLFGNMFTTFPQELASFIARI